MNSAQARFQLLRGRKLVPLLTAAAAKYGLPPAYVVAVASRETGIRNIEGDAGHGIGVIQIDVRWHSIARVAKMTGSWKTDPGALIDYGAHYLAEMKAWSEKTWPTYTSPQHLKITAASYNAGQAGAVHGVKEGDCDAFTTPPPYGADVMERMTVFAALLK